MVKMTSAYANKLIRRLNEDKNYWLNRESEGAVYVASVSEKPVIPEYDYAEVAAEINAIDQKIVQIRHAVNMVNVTNTIRFGDKEMSIDAVLVRMAQLNNRKQILDKMRKLQPKARVKDLMYGRPRIEPEYQYINFDPGLIRQEYERTDREIGEMQIALDKFNQTFEFEVDL